MYTITETVNSHVFIIHMSAFWFPNRCIMHKISCFLLSIHQMLGDYCFRVALSKRHKCFLHQGCKGVTAFLYCLSALWSVCPFNSAFQLSNIIFTGTNTDWLDVAVPVWSHVCFTKISSWKVFIKTERAAFTSFYRSGKWLGPDVVTFGRMTVCCWKHNWSCF